METNPVPCAGFSGDHAGSRDFMVRPALQLPCPNPGLTSRVWRGGSAGTPNLQSHSIGLSLCHRVLDGLPAIVPVPLESIQPDCATPFLRTLLLDLNPNLSLLWSLWDPPGFALVLPAQNTFLQNLPGLLCSKIIILGRPCHPRLSQMGPCPQSLSAGPLFFPL